MSKIGALLAKDARAVARDGFLFFMLLYGPLVALAIRLFASWVPVEGLSHYLAPVAPFVGGILAGSVLGFALVEERETRTALLLRVAPLPERILALHLGGSTTALALVSSVVCALVYGAPVHRPGLFAACLLVSALGSPLMMVFMGSVASNKIEAMAMSKLAGLVTGVPALLFVVPEAWWWTLAWSPWTWLYLGMLRAFTPDAQLGELVIPIPTLPDAVWPLVALVLIVVPATWLLRRYRRQIT